MIDIVCPKCKRRGTLRSADPATNDNESHLTFVPPEGFRKVQLGWASDQVILYCIDCAIAAELDGRGPAEVDPSSDL